MNNLSTIKGIRYSSAQMRRGTHGYIWYLNITSSLENVNSTFTGKNSQSVERKL